MSQAEEKNKSDKKSMESKLDKMNKELQELRKELKAERQRTEDLMVLCTTFRASFQGTTGCTVDTSFFKDYIKNVINRDSYCDFNRSIVKIVDEYEHQQRVKKLFEK